MRCAALLAALALRGLQVDRAGTGLVVEVYPAASLWSWQLPYCGYKGRANAAPCQQLVEARNGARRGWTWPGTNSHTGTMTTRSTLSWPPSPLNSPTSTS